MVLERLVSIRLIRTLFRKQHLFHLYCQKQQLLHQTLWMQKIHHLASHPRQSPPRRPSHRYQCKNKELIIPLKDHLKGFKEWFMVVPLLKMKIMYPSLNLKEFCLSSSCLNHLKITKKDQPSEERP